MNSEAHSPAELIRRVRAHIAKGDKAAEKSEQHYISAGQHLATLKQMHDDADGTWAEWEALLKEKIGIGKSRASELMQIADGRKTIEQVRSDTAKRTADAKAVLKFSASSGESAAAAERKAEHAELKKISPFRNGETEAPSSLRSEEVFPEHPEENADAPEASAEARKAEYGEEEEAEVKDAELTKEQQAELDKYGFVHVWPEHIAAAIQMVKQMSDDARADFFEGLETEYSTEEWWGHRINDYDNDLGVVHALIGAIGTDRTRALAKKIPRLVLQVVGKEALPDCQWCKGSGLVGATELGDTIKVLCACTRRKRGEDTFEAMRARIERENAETGIPQQDFSFGLEVTTKDGKVWASGVRLPTEEEAGAGFYLDYYARFELSKHGYTLWEDDPRDLLAFHIRRYDEPPLMKISGGKRKCMSFLHGTCGLLGWQGWHPISGGECECKRCKGAEKKREADRHWGIAP